MDLAEVRRNLETVEAGLDDTACIDLIRGLEDLKNAAAAAQARASLALDTARRAERSARGVVKEALSRGVGHEIALARRESPHRGGRHLGFARVVVNEMPRTLALMTAGRLSEWRATLLVRETACLNASDRQKIDTELCADAATLDGLGDRAVAAKARALAAKYDAASVVRRAAKAASERHVSVRPAPDSMAYLSALLPLKEAVACYARQRADAATIVGCGDPLGRTRSQVMADLLVERVTGRTQAEGHPIQVHLVVSDQVLFGDGTDPAWVPGFGDVPADIARQWVRDTATKDAETAETGDTAATVVPLRPEPDLVSLRRVYADPESGTLTAMDSKSRKFPPSLARFIDIRDRTCRTPWCDAPIRHHDHIEPHADGGRTTAHNGSGLCEACNYAKEGDGFTATPDATAATPGDAHTFTIRTPTGHEYRSVAPQLPKPAPRTAAVRQAAAG